MRSGVDPPPSWILALLPWFRGGATGQLHALPSLLANFRNAWKSGSRITRGVRTGITFYTEVPRITQVPIFDCEARSLLYCTSGVRGTPAVGVAPDQKPWN